MSIEIYDDFINKDSLTIIQNVLMSDEFPWYLNKKIVDEYDESPWLFQFTHTFYRDGQVSSPFFSLIMPILNNIKIDTLLRIKANLGTITPQSLEGGWHIDNNFDSKTAVFYLNTNNGGTKIKDSGLMIDSVENRFVVFDSPTIHTGVSQTDKNFRCVINFNFI